MKKIIITSATHGLGLRVANMLANRFEIIEATSEALPAFMQAKYVKIPKGVQPTFAHEMLKLALDTNAQFILPLQLAEIESLAASLLLFEEYGIQIICPTISQLQELDMLPNPTKELPLSLLSNKKDLMSDKKVDIEINGLGVVSDLGLDFILAIAR